MPQAHYGSMVEPRRAALNADQESEMCVPSREYDRNDATGPGVPFNDSLNAWPITQSICLKFWRNMFSLNQSNTSTTRLTLIVNTDLNWFVRWSWSSSFKLSPKVICTSSFASAMEGYNAVIFAYGRWFRKSKLGIIPRAIKDVFSFIRKTERKSWRNIWSSHVTTSSFKKFFY